MSDILSLLGANAAGSAVNSVLNVGSNYVNGLINEHFTDRYMDKWGSILAQVEQMKSAGMNPFAIAQLNLKNSNDSGVNASLSGMPPMSTMAELGNSVLNPTVKANMESLTNANNANARNQNADANQKELSLDYVVENLRKEGLLLNNKVILSNEYTGKYSLILALDVENLNLNINKTKAEIDKVKEEKAKIVKEVEKINEEISLMKTEEDVNKALARKTNIEAVIATYDKRIKEVEANAMEQYNILPGTADAAYFIAGLNGDESTTKAFVDAKNELAKAESKAQAEASVEAKNALDPVQKSINELVQKRDSEIATILARVDEYKKRLEENPHGLKTMHLPGLIEDGNRRIEDIKKKYNNQIQALQHGSSSSTSVGIAGGSHSRTNQ